ncbi:MAG: flagellin lysine-N-methylase [Eubacteriales bacterium]|nr:flagellin lysine-N-methylase [Eubacteriales bacterium]
MKLIAPDYYSSFSCIAGKCRNSCCIGWEIDIDEYTAEYYRTLSGDLGIKLKNSIAEGPSGSSFILSEEERCPFLNREGLCDIILQLGEDSLCQICSDHPRFRNYFSDRTEIGLGLCCESAAHLILTKKEKTHLTMICDDKCGEALSKSDADALEMRDKLIEIAQQREIGILSRIKKILFCFASETTSACIPASRMLTLEQLNSSWTDRLLRLNEYEKGNKQLDLSEFDQIFRQYATVFEQFLVYLLFRHFPDAVQSERQREYLLFIVSSVILTARMLKVSCSAANNFSCVEELTDIIREWSAEIEYSDENIEKLLFFFEDK